MHDVVVYMSSLPKIADHDRKAQVLQAFESGARSQGARVLLQHERQVIPSKLAVILGWVGKSIKGPHIKLRQDVISFQSQQGHRVMPIDGSCFKFADVNNQFLRYSLDGVYYNSNIYANQNSGPQHWQNISRTLRLRCAPWRNSGDHILVCLQRDGGWSMKGTDMWTWTEKTVRKIRAVTNRPIMIRPHPKHPIDMNALRDLPKVKLNPKESTIQDDLSGAWAAVFFNSSASVAAVLQGIPIFVADNDCVSWSVANHDIANIEAPATPHREQWLWDLSAAHWTDQQSQSGELYRHFLSFI
jgi:hypothetical protein